MFVKVSFKIGDDKLIVERWPQQDKNSNNAVQPSGN
jgi:hypothetical protein